MNDFYAIHVRPWLLAGRTLKPRRLSMGTSDTERSMNFLGLRITVDRNPARGLSRGLSNWLAMVSIALVVFEFANEPQLLLLALAGCSSPAPGPAPAPPDEPAGPEWFRDVTAEVGLDCRLRAGPTGSYFMPQVMGAGLALFDFDNDGRPDLFVLANAGPGSDATHRLFRNEDGRAFRDIDEYKQLLLAEKDQLARNLTEKLLVYSTGADIQFADREIVEEIVNKLKAKNYGFRTLVHEVVQSRVFLNT